MRQFYFFILLLFSANAGLAQGNNAISVKNKADSAAPILIRCLPSVVTDQQPLLIVDGKISSLDLKHMDVNSIESIEILKDNAATALYGVRGVNGVIYIKTKTPDGQIFQLLDEEDGSGLTGATVTFVRNGRDSLRMLADQNGKLQVDNLKPGYEYDVSVTAIGYKNFAAKLKISKEKASHQYKLARDVKENEEIIVRSFEMRCTLWRRTCLESVCGGDMNLSAKKETPLLVGGLNAIKSRVYPNPVKRGASFKIELNAENALAKQIKVFNLSGALLHSMAYEPVKGLNQIDVPVASHWAAGMYAIQMIDNKGKLIHQHKILIQ